MRDLPVLPPTDPPAAGIGERTRRRRMLEAQALALRDARATAAGIGAAEDFPVVLIPAFAAPATRLPKQRRRTFRAHLERVARDAVAQRDADAAALRDGAAPAPAPPEPAAPTVAPGLAALQGGACARCGGYCCREGGEHAYLTVDVLRRVLDADPSLDADALVATYLGHVGAVTMRRSCVYHGPRGCGLPRALRSATCNQYFCAGLAALGAAPGAPARAFLAQIDDDARGDVRSGAFVAADDAGGVDAREVRLARAAVTPAPPG